MRIRATHARKPGPTTTISCWPTAMRFDVCTTRASPLRLPSVGGVGRPTTLRINEGETLANADWQAEHLKSLGYKYFQMDEGYQYARGEYITANATQFPDGMRFVGYRRHWRWPDLWRLDCPFRSDQPRLGLRAPQGLAGPQRQRRTHLHATSGIRKRTCSTRSIRPSRRAGISCARLTELWSANGASASSNSISWILRAIEGYRYRPNTTALEAQRIGLQIIRDTVGEDVVLDKDGSPMLNPVGLVDTGRIFRRHRAFIRRNENGGAGIAARFYMHRNFFVDDPDAFNTTEQAFFCDIHGRAFCLVSSVRGPSIDCSLRCLRRHV